MKKTLLLPFLALLLLGAGCTAQKSAKQDEISYEKGSLAAGSRVAFQNQTISQGDVILTFDLYGEGGDELTDEDLSIAHEKLLHFILVRNDMRGYQHIHPEYLNGSWIVSTSIPDEGMYDVYVDIDPKDEDALVLRKTLTVGNAMTGSGLPEATPGMATTVMGTLVALTTEPSLVAGEEVELTFTLASNGVPLTNIEPYLGAYGHVVALRHNDPEVYLHAHPLTETQPTDGQVKFATTFPEAGGYTFFPQFNIGGEVITFPITVEVVSGANSPGTSPTMDHGSGH